MEALRERSVAVPSRLWSRLKGSAAWLPYPLFLRTFLAWYYVRDLRRAEQVRRRAAICLLPLAELQSFKKSDTVFLLGSGSSINRISADRWQGIAQHDTMGFNFWLFHPFVPRMYFCETIMPQETRMFEEFSRIAMRRTDEYAETLKVATELHNAFPEGMLAFPQAWMPAIRTMRTVPVAARNEQELAYGIDYLKSKGIFDDSSQYVFKQLSTVSFLVALAAKLAYRKIVLCGIDLNDSCYFYQDAELYPETRDLAFVPQASKHATFSPMRWRIPIDRVLLELKRQVLDPAGVAIYLENRSSALWPAIPEAPATLFEPGDANELLSAARETRTVSAPMAGIG